MTRQTLTSFVAAGVFVLLAVLLVVIPVPFVTWSPGGTRDVLADGPEPIIDVRDAQTFATAGRLDLTVVSTTAASSRLSLPQALLAYWRPDRDALPRESIYPPGSSVEQIEHADAELMETAQDDAVVAALRAVDQPVREMPAVYSVTVGGPAHQRLLPGDLVQRVNGVMTPDPDAVSTQIRAARVGERLTFTVLRRKKVTTVTVTTAASNTQSGVPVVGITLGTGYSYGPSISFELGRKIGGPSAGLVFALAIYDKLTPGELLAGRHVAGTGTINPQGRVGGIGGIQEKIAGAEAAGATVFLVPAANCADLEGVTTSMQLVRVGTLEEAVGAVAALDGPDGPDDVPRCE